MIDNPLGLMMGDHPSTRILSRFHLHGEMEALFSRTQWAATLLGDPDTWSAAFCSSVSLCLHSPTPTLVLWGPQRALLHNAHCLELMPEVEDSLIGQPVAEAWPQLWQALEQTKTTGDGGGLSGVSLRQRSGIEAAFTAVSVPIWEQDDVVGMVVTLIPQAVRQAPTWVRPALLDALPVAVYTCDATGRIDYYNQRAVELWGREPFLNHEVGGEYFCACFRVYLPDGKFVPPDQTPMALAVREGRSFRNLEAEVERPDGTRFTASVSIDPLHDSNGQMCGAINVFTDISDVKVQRDTLLREIAERQLREEEQRAYLQRLPVCCYILDAEGVITFFNDEAARLWGRTPEIGVEKWSGACRMYGADRSAIKLESFAPALALREGRSFRGPVTLLERPNGELCSFIPQADLLLDPVGRCCGVICVLLDISEQREAAMAARRLAAIVESTDDAIISKNLDGIVLTWNRAAEKLFGYTEEEMVGGSILKLIPDNRHQEETEILDSICRGVKVDHYETVRRRKDGTLREVSLTISPMRDEAGRVVSASKIARDITERKAADRELQRSQAKLSAIFDQAGAGIAMLDLEGRFIMVNDAYCEIAGAGQERLLQMRVHEVTHPEDRDTFASYFQKLAAEGPSLVIDKRYLRADGATVWVRESIVGIREAGEKLTGSLAVVQDITESRAFEDRLIAREEQFRLVADHVPVFIAQIGRDLRYRFVNQSYSRHYGHEAEVMRGMELSEVLSEPEFRDMENALERVFAGVAVEYEYQQRGYWWHAMLTPERREEQAVSGCVVVIADVTQRRQAELETARARDQALAASRAKDEFLAALSHELRTPLTPVLLIAAEAAADPSLPTGLKESFESIRKSVELEARLIDDLLDLTRITRGKMALEMRPTAVHEVIEDAIMAVQLEAEQKNVAITMDMQATNDVVQADAVRLQQIIWNILKNAVKFTPEGGAVNLMTRNLEGDCVSILVTDTGMGMTPEELGGIFEPFAQGEHAGGSGASHRFGGLGLGLAITQLLVQAHNGQILAESEGRDRGAKFEVTLPLSQLPLPSRGRKRDKSSPVAPVHGLRILLVEDHAPTRNVFASLLKKRGYELGVARCVKEALELAEAQPFDLVLSDLGLPDGTGYDLMDQLRQRHDLRGIALSGYGMEHDIERSRKVGFARHLIKPVRFDLLESAIAEIQQE